MPDTFFSRVDFMSSTELCDPWGCSRLALSARAWGAVTGLRLESVKLSAEGASALAAVGGATLLVQGALVGRLLGVPAPRWQRLQRLASTHPPGVYYRYFRNGVTATACTLQRLFYHLCSTRHLQDVLYVYYERVPNLRRGETPVLQVLALSRHTPTIHSSYRLLAAVPQHPM